MKFDDILLKDTQYVVKLISKSKNDEHKIQNSVYPEAMRL
jgi:hypothetical protein